LNPRPRTLAVTVLAVAVLAQTWLWIGVTGAPVGYTVERADGFRSADLFLMPDPALAQPVSLAGGRLTFAMTLTSSTGRTIRVTERVAPAALVFSPQDPAAIRTLAQDPASWDRTATTAPALNSLHAWIGRVSVTIEGDLTHDELFAIARTLRPFSANWML
jgi:hypothetical protein